MGRTELNSCYMGFQIQIYTSVFDKLQKMLKNTATVSDRFLAKKWRHDDGGYADQII